MHPLLQTIKPYLIPVGATVLVTSVSVLTLLHITEHVDQHLLNQDQMTPLILNSPNSSAASIWFTRYHFQTKFLKVVPLALSNNMYLIQLANSNDFIIYNPSKLTPSIKLSLLQLLQERKGQLKYVIVGTEAHTMFFEDYLHSFDSTKALVPMERRNYFIKQLSNKSVAHRVLECHSDAQTGKVVLEEWNDPSIALYQLQTGNAMAISEMVMLEKSTKTLLVTDSAQNFDPQTTMVRKPNQESFLSKIYSRVCGVRDKFAVHRLIASAVKKPEKVKQILHAMRQELPQVENMLVAHGIPIVRSHQNMMEEYINAWREYI